MSGPWEDYQPKEARGPWEDYQPAAVTAGKAVNKGLSDIPRQFGLTARYALEGPAQAAQIITEPIRHLITDPLARWFGSTGGQPLEQAVSQLADKIGLPKPEGANERVIGTATKLMAGTGGMASVASAASALPAMAGKVFAGLAANPAQQIGSAAGAGLLGGASREGGGGAGEQAAAGLLGSVVGGLAPGAAHGLYDAGKRLLTPALTPKQIDIKLAAVLGQAGTDYNQLPVKVQTQLRSELADALQAGKELDPKAVARLADLRAVGATPTRGMVSQDPVQITREMNLAKTAANTSDSQLHGLPRIQNENNTTLIRNLNDAGATAGDPFKAGSNVIGTIGGIDAAKAKDVTGLYNAARAMPGADVPLNRSDFVNNIYDTLTKQNKAAYLPADIQATLNTISKGEVNVGGKVYPVPFDANALDNILTDIATAQRGTQDGNVKAALKLAREAIDKTPIAPIKNTFHGGQVATGAGADFLKMQDASAGQYMEALNQARAAARSRFGWQESAKPIEAALGGAEPDKFIQKFVIGGTVADAKAIADTAPAAGVKEAILAHLKDKSLNGASDEIGKFSQSAYNKALGQIGDRKLSLFFSPEELAHLKSVGRAASIMQNQPVGSAVNNSNSGAMLAGKAYDALSGLAGHLPFGKAAIVDPMRSLSVSIGEHRAQNLLPGLLAEQPKPPFAQGLLLPGMVVGGGLLAPGTP